MQKTYILFIALLFGACLSNLNAQREEILYDGGNTSQHFGAITISQVPGEDSPGSTTTGAAEIVGGAWGSGGFSDDVDNLQPQNIDLMNGTFELDYKTSDVSQIFSLNLQDWSTASSAVVTFLTGPGSYNLTADGAWHTLTIPFNTDWEAGVMGVDFQVTDYLNPRITFQFGASGGTILLDNFVYNDAPHVATTGVSLDQNTLDLAPAETATLVRTIAPANASNQTVTWSSSNSTIASVSGGVVTANTAGTCEITVTTNDGGFTDVCAVTVANISVTGVTLNDTAITLEIGASDTLVPTIEPANATDTSLLPWVSNNTGVATVTDGIVTAHSSGTANITITTADGFLTATCTVTVPGAPASIFNNKASDIIIYPVPAESIITISNIANFNNIEIIDLTGHIILSIDNKESVKEINIESLNSGSYILNLNSANETIIKKFIIE